MKSANSLFHSIPLAHDANRRSDDSVRLAIDAMQALLFDPQAAEKIFPLLLRQVTNITQSHYGVIYTADANAVKSLTPEARNSLNVIYSDNSPPFICPSALAIWVEKNILPLRPVFFNAPIPTSHTQLLLYKDKISALIMLPIISQNALKGICILGKAEGEYSAEVVRRLIPLLGSVICALQSADKVKGNLFDLNQKISDNRFLTALISTSLTAILVIDSTGKIHLSNPVANQMFGMQSIDGFHNDADSLKDRDAGVLIPKLSDLFKWSKQKAPYGDGSLFLGPQIWECQQAYRLDQTPFYINLTAFRYTHGSERFTTLQIQDITAMRESAEEYQQASQQLNALTNLVPVGIIQVDSSWQCTYANDRWYAFTGLVREENIQTGWINAIHSDDVKKFLENLREAIQAGKEFGAEIRLVSPLGQVRWVSFDAQVLFSEVGVIQGFLATVADITERLVHQERLRHVAEYDSLTGLANRNLFQDRLQKVFYGSERDSSKITVLFMDLDGFKDVNDSLGHDAGDKLLQQVADRLLNILRRNDTVARFGGDEFVVLLSNQEKVEQVITIAQKVIDAIARPYKINNEEIYVTASLGVAIGSGRTSSCEQILKQADTALYLAKAEGKNNFQLFDEEMDKKAKNRIYLANQLRIALQKKRFFLAYQPQASLSTKELIGFEALLRFKDDNEAVIYPDQFIPILEETGMIVNVGKWIVDEACRQLRSWKSQNIFPEDGFISINMSPKQLLDESILSLITETCGRYQINPKNLVLEITESVLIDKPHKVQKIMQQLKQIGIKLALDDFGTGYSSLTYLQRYPFDHIKIDKTFISDLLVDENDAKITKAIIALAQSLGLKVTAEGVVSAELLDVLCGYGVDYFQGYYLGEPESAIDSAVFMNSKTA